MPRIADDVESAYLAGALLDLKLTIGLMEDKRVVEAWVSIRGIGIRRCLTRRVTRYNL